MRSEVSVRTLTIWASWEIVGLYALTVALYIGMTAFLLVTLARDGHPAVAVGIAPVAALSWLGVLWQFRHVLAVSADVRRTARKAST